MSTLMTTNSARAFSPDVQWIQPLDAIPTALLLQCATHVGTVEGDAPAVRVGYITDDNAAFVNEGAIIPASEDKLDEILIYTRKLAKLSALSKEQAATATEGIGTTLQRAITRGADAAFVNQAPAAAGATGVGPGLLHTVGATTLDAAVLENLDPLVDLIAELETNYAKPSHILMAPKTWAAMRRIKALPGGAASLLGAGTNDAVPLLLGLPVIVTPAMPVGKGIVLDKSDVAAAYGEVEMALSEHSLFARDSIQLRATWRFGWMPVHPERLGIFDIDVTGEGKK